MSVLDLLMYRAIKWQFLVRNDIAPEFVGIVSLATSISMFLSSILLYFWKDYKLFFTIIIIVVLILLFYAIYLKRKDRISKLLKKQKIDFVDFIFLIFGLITFVLFYLSVVNHHSYEAGSGNSHIKHL